MKNLFTLITLTALVFLVTAGPTHALDRPWSWGWLDGKDDPFAPDSFDDGDDGGWDTPSDKKGDRPFDHDITGLILTVFRAQPAPGWAIIGFTITSPAEVTNPDGPADRDQVWRNSGSGSD